VDYTVENFTYLQIGAHGSFNVFEQNSIPYIKYHYGSNWKIVITEPANDKFNYLSNSFLGFPNTQLLNIGIHSVTSAKHYSIDFLPVVEEIEAESGIFEEMTYDLYIGPKYEGNFSTLPAANEMKAQILEKFYAIPWITQVGSYNFSSILSPNHLTALPELADYVIETADLVTWTPLELMQNLKIRSIDILQISQSGDDYEIVKSLPFEDLELKHLTFKTLHMSTSQILEIDTLLNSKGFVRDDSWLLDFSHVGYTQSELVSFGSFTVQTR
jgi:hypothetical protein